MQKVKEQEFPHRCASRARRCLCATLRERELESADLYGIGQGKSGVEVGDNSCAVCGLGSHKARLLAASAKRWNAPQPCMARPDTKLYKAEWLWTSPFNRSLWLESSGRPFSRACLDPCLFRLPLALRLPVALPPPAAPAAESVERCSTSSPADPR